MIQGTACRPGPRMLTVGLLLVACSQAAGPSVTPEQQRNLANALYNNGLGVKGVVVKRNLANALYNNGLYTQAVEAYEQYLTWYDVDPESRAHVYYVIGNIYFDRERDYQNALGAYLRIKHLHPESALLGDVNKKIVACLERLDRSADAAQALKESTSLDPDQVPESRPGEVIARIGDRAITQGDLDFMIDTEMAHIPAEMRPRDFGREQKLGYLRQYLSTELLYNTAQRRGLERDKDAVERVFQAKKMILADMVRQAELDEKVDVTKAEIELYYEQHKEDFAEKDSTGTVVRQPTLSEVQQQVARQVVQQARRQVLDDLFSRMVEAQNVQIYEDKVQ